MPREGILFVISAPSGAGKTSLCKEIIDFFPGLRHSVSYTTRPARAGERAGTDYHFVSPEIFAGMVARGEFAEWAEVHGNRYGTSLKPSEAPVKPVGISFLTSIAKAPHNSRRLTGRESSFLFCRRPSRSFGGASREGIPTPGRSSNAASPTPVEKSGRRCGMIIWSSTTSFQRHLRS